MKQIALGIACLGVLAATAHAAAPTFHKDVLPVLQNHCQSCHRAGEIGPMAFSDYKSVRPWAKAMKQAVVSKKMPPWFANPSYSHFANDRSMPQKDVETLVAWVDAGAPEGNRKDAPPPRTFVEGWNIGKPDHVVEMPNAFSIPAEGKVDYQFVVIPMDLKEDKWIQMVEARPDQSARAQVHHIVAFARAPESNWLRGEATPGIPFVPPRTFPDGRPRSDIGGMGNEILTIYTPGNVPDVWKPGRAKLLRAGSDIVLQLHYTVNGKAVQDRSRVGFIWAKEKPTERVMSITAQNNNFRIPPGDPNYKVDGAMPIRNDALLLSFFPHMHLRGKAFEYRLRDADGTTQTVLKVDKYDFNWQLTYHLKEPIPLKPGQRVEASGWFDNSPNNPFNPDPAKEVRFGEQSWEEMMIGFFDIVIDARHPDLRSWLSGKKPSGD